MIRRLRWMMCVMLGVLAACGSSSCERGKAPSAKVAPAVPAPRADLRLLVLTDPRGYLEPCGCSQRPLGGLDKLATEVARARKDDVPTLLLAAGDLATGMELRPEDGDAARKQEEMRAETFVAAWSQIGVDAATPGPLDLAQGPELKSLIEKSSFPWIVDNAPEDASVPLSSARILEAGGIKVGVLGLVAPDPLHPSRIPLSDELPQLAQRKSAELRAEGAQLVVALVSGERKLARAVAGKGVDVVVMGGVDLEQPLSPTVLGRAVILHAGYQGQSLVSVELAGLAKEGDWEDASAWSRKEAQRELERQIAELRTRIAEWAADPKVAPADLEAQRARLKQLLAERDAPKLPRYAGRWLSAKQIELAPEVPEDPAIAAQLDAHDIRVNEYNRESLKDRKPQPAKPGEAHYVGSESCASCHEAAYAWWTGTKHGRAYATLERVHKEFSLSCVGCHVTGYNEPGGSTVTHVENLKNVGCENCHGPGSQHAADPKLPGAIRREVQESTCLSCHTHEHSERFAYDAFRRMLIVPGHGAPADRQ